MAEKNEIYKCEVCSMVAEVKEAGRGELVCAETTLNCRTDR